MRELESGIIDVWRVRLCEAVDSSDARLNLPQLLGREEQARASRMATPLLQRRFVESHVALRQLLADYVGGSAAAIRYQTLLNGKPVLAGDGAGMLHFNLSHSGRVALVAIRRDAPVGADVEAIRDDVDLWSVAAQVYTAAEQGRLRELPIAKVRQHWFRMWTRKEAVLKAIGTGMQFDPRDVEIAADGRKASLGLSRGSLPADVDLVEIADFENCAAAVASVRPIVACRSFWYDDILSG